MRARPAAALLCLSLLASVAACAPAAPATGVTAKYDPLVIRADEINAEQHAYVLDVIKQARPNWLTASDIGSGIQRAVGFAVYEDDRRVGDLEMLSKILTSSVASIRFVESTRASFLPGMGGDVVRGAIVLTMKH